jgi:hypothetical protein
MVGGGSRELDSQRSLESFHGLRVSKWLLFRHSAYGVYGFRSRNIL